MTDEAEVLAKPLDRLFATLWQQYVAITPDAARVHQLLRDRGEQIINDHIALRTFAHPAVGIDVLAQAFVAGGYRASGQYRFPEKKLFARHYEHPDPGRPKVFISELLLTECSPRLRAVVASLLEQMPPGQGERRDFPASGRPWQLAHSTYLELLEESEYAAWMAAFGFRANHFTVAVNELTTLAGLEELNQLLLASGFELNLSGGAIKGTPADLLEQSSTIAREVPVAFTDGAVAVRSCYYEFARRYPDAGGRLFSGFIPTSANRLFESTDVAAPG